MIRNLKVLALAGMALVALGAFAASGAQAAEFRCSVEPCRYTLKQDGAGQTGHQVFAAKNSAGESLNFTCSQLTGEATTAGKTASELTFVPGFNITCNAFGFFVPYRFNGCDFRYGASGTFSIKNCPKAIELEIAETGCVLKLPEQGPVSGVSLHNVGEEGKTTTEVTGGISELPLTGSLNGTTEQCGINMTKTPITITYKTGNFLITGETDPGGVMANAWWS